LAHSHGTVRFSFGWFNTAEEVDASLAALREIAAWAERRRGVIDGLTVFLRPIMMRAELC
jgi:hypothetical protein